MIYIYKTHEDIQPQSVADTFFSHTFRTEKIQLHFVAVGRSWWSSAEPPPDTYTAPGSCTQMDDPDLVHSEEELSLCDTSSSAPLDTDDEIIEIEREAREKNDQ